MPVANSLNIFSPLFYLFQWYASKPVIGKGMFSQGEKNIFSITENKRKTFWLSTQTIVFHGSISRSLGRETFRMGPQSSSAAATRHLCCWGEPHLCLPATAVIFPNWASLRALSSKTKHFSHPLRKQKVRSLLNWFGEALGFEGGIKHCY